jgi:predicted DNA-binding transcriptional regulator AlpA
MNRTQRLPERVSEARGDAQSVLVGAATVAAMLQIGQRTLWRWISTGVFPGPDVSIGAKIRRWRRETVDNWITSQAGEGVSK